MVDYHEQDDTEMRDAFVSVTETQKALVEHQAPMVRLTFMKSSLFCPLSSFQGLPTVLISCYLDIQTAEVAADCRASFS